MLDLRGLSARRPRPSSSTVAFTLAFCSCFALTTAVTTTIAAAAGPAGDHLVITRVDGTTAAANPVALVRVNGAGASDGPAFALPTAAAGANQPFTLAGDTAAEGAITRSTDGRYAVLAGYAAAPGTVKVGSTATTVARRVVARVAEDGTVDTSTTLGGAFGGDKVRSAASDDGSRFWVSGNGNNKSSTLPGGVVFAPLGNALEPTVILGGDATSNNFRTVQIVGGQLYASSDKTLPIGLSRIPNLLGALPTTAQTASSLLATPTTATPPAFVLLKRSEATTGSIDTAYVAVEGSGLVKFSSPDGVSWTQRGTIPGDFRQLAGRTEADGTARIYGVVGETDANEVRTVADATAYDAAPDPAAVPSVVAGAASGSAFRGVAFAPGSPVTPGGPSDAVPTISLAEPALGGAIGDGTAPSATVTVGLPDGDAAGLQVTATATSNPAVATTAGVTVSGSGATRTVAVAPAGAIGFADITLQVKAPSGTTATTVLRYAAQRAPTATSRFYGGTSDLSTAFDVGDGYVLAAGDEDNVLRLYRGDRSGAPVKSWDFSSQAGASEEIDIEGAARSGDTITWTGSLGNSKKGKLKPNRAKLFTTRISGSGAATELSFGGVYDGLRDDLIAWDRANGDRFGFARGAAEPNIPKQVDGFNVEGLEFAPGSTSTAYVAFRAPVVPATAAGKALLVPVTNIDRLTTGGGVRATFGPPILFDLGGLSIREIRKNADDEYLIVAGSWAAGGSFALYSWDGVPSHPPARTLTELPANDTSGEDPGSWESIVSVPHPLVDGAPLQLIMDNGSSDLYGDGAEAKAAAFPAWRTSRADRFTLRLQAATVGPDSLVFGEQPQATIGAARTVTVTAGSTPLDVSRIAISGPGADDFLVGREDCTADLLTLGRTCTVGVRFAPGSTGAKAATLSVRTRDGATLPTVALSGTGGALPKGIRATPERRVPLVRPARPVSRGLPARPAARATAARRGRRAIPVRTAAMVPPVASARPDPKGPWGRTAPTVRRARLGRAAPAARRGRPARRATRAIAARPAPTPASAARSASRRAGVSGSPAAS